MKRLWAPWRMEYILGDKTQGCVFCTELKEDHDRKNYILYRGGKAFVIMNIYPYNNGHLMVVPNRHIASLTATTDDERAELMRLTLHAELALTEAYRPQGINVGINLGRAAGAGVIDHLHIHLVPRWNGDTNFMPLFAETRVMPEHLETTYRKLVERLMAVFRRLPFYK